jgi:hypothetical protein
MIQVMPPTITPPAPSLKPSVRRRSGRSVALVVCLVVCLVVTALAAGCATLAGLQERQRALFEALYYEGTQYAPERICHVHRVATVLESVPLIYGLSIAPSRRYVHARLKEFPNSFLEVYTGLCEKIGPEPETTLRWVCPRCRVEESKWRVHSNY